MQGHCGAMQEEESRKEALTDQLPPFIGEGLPMGGNSQFQICTCMRTAQWVPAGVPNCEVRKSCQHKKRGSWFPWQQLE